MDPDLGLLSLCHPCILHSASLGECVACVFDKDIRVFNIDNAAKPIRILSGHVGRIISISTHPLQPMQLLSIDTSGQIITWDVFAESSIKNFSFDFEIIFARATTEGTIVISKEDGHNKLRQYPWADDRELPEQKEKFCVECQLHYKSGSETIAVGCENRLVAMIAEHLTIAVYNVKKEGKVSSLNIPEKFLTHPNVRLTALALHPRLDHMAGGLSSGVIVLWRGGLRQGKVSDQRKKRQTGGEEEKNATSIITRLHWHPLAVHCLAYSTNGAFLFSGGHEAVLVKWDLTGGASSSRRRTLLPRLRAPLAMVGAASSCLLFAILSDHSLVLLAGAAFEVSAVIHGRLLRSTPAPARHLRASCNRHLAGLILDPATDNVVANARPGSLQWLAGNTVLDVTEENYVPLEPADGGDPTESCSTEVLLAAFAPDGVILATYEALPLADTGRCLRRIKWWVREATQWRLIHCANASHHGAFVALCFAPASVNLVAVSADAIVAWNTVENEAWRERFAWNAGAEADNDIAACTFNHDASPDMLALSRGRSLMLWRWPESSVAFSPTLVTRVELDEAAVQLCWPHGGALFARTNSGDVVAWRDTDLSTPAFRLTICATVLAVHGECVAACTAGRHCLLLQRESGDVLHSLQLSAKLCCAAVTSSGLLLGLGNRPDHLERLWTSPQKANGAANDQPKLPMLPSRPAGGLLGKLEALSAQRDVLSAAPEGGEVWQRQRLAESASARIRERLEEFVRSPATCAPDLEQLALATLRLQTEYELKSTF